MYIDGSYSTRERYLQVVFFSFSFFFPFFVFFFLSFFDSTHSGRIDAVFLLFLQEDDEDETIKSVDATY